MRKAALQAGSGQREQSCARAIVIATGAQYNEPPLGNLDKFTAREFITALPFMEAQLCEREDVAVVGGGNSADKRLSFSRKRRAKVYMLARSGKLSDTMSRYLISAHRRKPCHRVHKPRSYALPETRISSASPGETR